MNIPATTWSLLGSPFTSSLKECQGDKERDHCIEGNCVPPPKQHWEHDVVGDESD